jgi:hypothetical protein
MSIPVICDRCRSTGIAGESDFSHLGDLLDFDPVPRKSRRVDGWNEDRQRAFIAALSATGSKRRAALSIGMQPYGVDQLLKAQGSHSFKAAFARAMAIAEKQGAMKIAQGVADAAARSAQLTQPSRLRGLPAPPDPHDQAELMRLADLARDSISKKLLGCRRLYLKEIADSPGKRAAYEILTQHPIDWDKAARMEEQPDEPWRKPNFREPDMLVTAENGWMGDMVHGPDKRAELREAVDKHREEEGLPAVEWDSESTERSDADA